MNKSIIFPPEYCHHKGTIAMFPFRNDIWRNNAVEIQNYIIKLIKCISNFEHVYLIYHPCCKSIVSTINLPNVSLIEMKYNDIWARDISPTFVYNDGIINCINWSFNAWGGKKEGAYSPWDDDNDFPKQIAKYFDIPLINVNLTLEGGAIIPDGNGTIFTTRSVLLNRNRNPFKSKEYVETLLKKNLGVEKVIWIKQGLATDETNGHVDNILSVIRPGELCVSWTDDKSNPNYKRVHDIYNVISNEYNGIIHKIPLPSSQYMTIEESSGIVSNPNSIPRNAGDLLPASYLNFYYVNGGVIMPSFNCKEDSEVLSIFQQLFPDRKVMQIYSREPLLGGGGIHCLLHEIPEMEIKI